MAKDSRPVLTQTQLKNTSHKIDPLDSKKNSPGKKGASRRTKKENKEVQAKIRDIKIKKKFTPGESKTRKGGSGKKGYPGGLKTRKGGDPGKS